jgi:hypothetical protein
VTNFDIEKAKKRIELIDEWLLTEYTDILKDLLENIIEYENSLIREFYIYDFNIYLRLCLTRYLIRYETLVEAHKILDDYREMLDK